MTIRNDRRTAEQKNTHRYLVTATDRFMSGWGLARGGASKCAWACETFAIAQKQAESVRSRGDMKYVHIHHGAWYPKAAHVSIYVVNSADLEQGAAPCSPS
jgi:hypothetical protein